MTERRERDTAHTTQNEVEFIQKLGTFAEFGPDMPKIELLRLYRHANLEKRERCGKLDMHKVIRACDDEIRRLTRFDAKVG